MSRSRLAVSMIGITALLACTFYLAAGWFPLTGAPVFAQDQNTGSEIKAPKEMPVRVAPTPMPVQKQSSNPKVKAPQRVPILVAEARMPPQEQSPAIEIKAPRGEPIRVGGNIQESKLIHRVNPTYPEQAKNARIKGTVRLQVTINEEGFVWDVQVLSGHPLLSEAAIAAVKQWQYSPTLLNGVPVPVQSIATAMFDFMDFDDLPVMMDESGNLSIGREQLLQVKGTVYLRIAPFTPYRVAESVVRDLMQKGVQKMELSGPYVLYQERLFYDGLPPTGMPPAYFGADKVHKLPDSLAAEISKGKSLRFHCQIYYNEAGEALGLQRMGGDEFPELEKEILLIREEPVLINGEPVPFARNFDWVMGAAKIER